MYAQWGIAFRFHVRVLDSTCQGPCNRLLEGWSHDQCPKIEKAKVVDLHSSILNLFEISYKVLHCEDMR